MNISKRWDSIIIGAGIAGLACARELAKQGRDVLLLEKSRGVGGRISTRRIDGVRFNHGAQYIMARDYRFELFLEPLRLSGIVGRYALPIFESKSSKFPYDNGRYTAIPDMNSLPRSLASDLNLLVKKKITSLRGSSDGWRIIAENGDEYLAGSLVMTNPVPQAIELLDNSGVFAGREVDSALRKIKYHKTLAAMLKANWTKFENLNVDDLASAGIDRIAPAIENEGLSDRDFVVHLDHVISERKFEYANTRIISYLANVLRPIMEFEIENVILHRWRYSMVRSGSESRSLIADTRYPLIFAGDAFGGGCCGIETAYLSGLDAADKLMKIMPGRE